VPVPTGGTGGAIGTGGSTGGVATIGGTGGAAGSGGTGGSVAGTAGSTNPPQPPTPCTAITTFTSPTIYEFPEPVGQGGAGGDGAGGDGGEGGASSGPEPIEGFSFGFNGNASGYSFYYPEGPLTSDISQGSWHVAGTVAAYSGFQIGIVCGADASAYKGITFKIAGNAGPSGSLTFVVGHAANAWSDPINPSASAAKCMAPNQYDGTCLEARAVIDVEDSETTVSLEWADITGGNPDASPNPAELVGLRWLFDWDETKQADAAANAYEVDVRVDEIRFIE
jgi:hypothetical protein